MPSIPSLNLMNRSWTGSLETRFALTCLCVSCWFAITAPTLPPLWSARFFLGLLFLGAGCVLRAGREEEPADRFLRMALLLSGAVSMMFPLDGSFFGRLLHALSPWIGALAILSFMVYTLSFVGWPVDGHPLRGTARWVFGVGICVSFPLLGGGGSLRVGLWFAFLCVLLSIGLWAISYVRSRGERERHLTRWILIGLLTGPLVWAAWFAHVPWGERPLVTEEIAVASLSTVPIGVVLAMVPFRDLRKPTRTQGISTWWWVGSLGAFVGAVGPSIPLVLMAVFLGLLLLEGRTTQNSDRLRLDPISGVAHDLRTPLTGIRLHTQSLRETPRMGSKRRAWHLEVIEGEVDRMTRLISGLLHPASVERGTRTYHRIPSEMGELVERSLRTMKATSRKGGPRLERVFCGESLPFLGDPDAVVMAVAEVVRNAVKYSDGKPVRVETLWKPGFVGVRVIDRGLGIAKQEQERVFEPFFRSSRPEIQAVDGTGFGLSLVEQTVNSHGGHLEVESDSFQGTRLTLWFPGKVQG